MSTASNPKAQGVGGDRIFVFKPGSQPRAAKAEVEGRFCAAASDSGQSFIFSRKKKNKNLLNCKEKVLFQPQPWPESTCAILSRN